MKDNKDKTTKLPPLAPQTGTSFNRAASSKQVASNKLTAHAPQQPSAPKASHSSPYHRQGRTTKPSADQLAILELQKTIEQQAQKIECLQKDNRQLAIDKHWGDLQTERVRQQLLSEITARDQAYRRLEQEKADISVKLNALVRYLASCSERYGDKWRHLLKPKKPAAAISSKLSSLKGERHSLTSSSALSDLTTSMNSTQLDSALDDHGSDTVDLYRTNRIREATPGIEEPDSWPKCRTLLNLADQLLLELAGETDIGIQQQIDAELHQIVDFIKAYQPAPTLALRRPAMTLGQAPERKSTLVGKLVIPSREPESVKKFLYNDDGHTGWVRDFLQATTAEALEVSKDSLRVFLSQGETQDTLGQHEDFLANFPSSTDCDRSKYIKDAFHKYFIEIALIDSKAKFTYGVDLISLYRAPTHTSHHVPIVKDYETVTFKRSHFLNGLNTVLDDLKQQFDSVKKGDIDYLALKLLFSEHRKFTSLFQKDPIRETYSTTERNVLIPLCNTQIAFKVARKANDFDSYLTSFQDFCQALIAHMEDRKAIVKKNLAEYDAQLNRELQEVFDTWCEAHPTKLSRHTDSQPIQETHTLQATSLMGIFPSVEDTEDHRLPTLPIQAEQTLIQFVYGEPHGFASDLWQQFNDPSVHQLDLSRLEAFAKAHRGASLFEKDPLNDLYLDNTLNRFHHQVKTIKATQDFASLMKSFNIYYRHALQVMLPSMQTDYLKAELNRACHHWQTEHAHAKGEIHIRSAAKPLVHPIDSVENDHREHHEPTLTATHDLQQSHNPDHENIL